MQRFLLTVACLGFAVAVCAENIDPLFYDNTELEYNEELEVPWVELEAEVKKMPNEDSLVEAELESLPPAMKLYVDMDSIEVGSDLVTRAWVVAKSSSGAYNASFEGFRCADGWYKVYAYLNPKRSEPLRVINLPRWREAKAGRYRAELMEDFLCSGTRPENVRDVADNLRQNAAVQHSPF